MTSQKMARRFRKSQKSVIFEIVALAVEPALEEGGDIGPKEGKDKGKPVGGTERLLMRQDIGGGWAGIVMEGLAPEGWQ